MSPETLPASVDEDTTRGSTPAQLEDALFCAVLKTTGSFVDYLADPNNTPAPEAHLEPVTTLDERSIRPQFWVSV